MSDPSFPVPFSHKTFDLGGVVFDSNFDSGNLYNAERVNALSVLIKTCSIICGWQSTTSRISIALGSIFQWQGSNAAA